MKTIVFIALYRAGVFFALKNINLFHPFFAVTVPRNRMELQIFSTKLSACIKRVKLHCNIKCWSSNIRQMAKNDYRGNSHNYSKQMMTWEVRFGRKVMLLEPYAFLPKSIKFCTVYSFNSDIFLSLWHFVHVKTIISLLPQYASSSLAPMAQILACCAYDDSAP